MVLEDVVETDKIKIDIEIILAARKILKDINNLSIDNIEWYKDAKLLDITSECLDEWKFTGLNITDFIEYEFYNCSIEEG